MTPDARFALASLATQALPLLLAVSMQWLPRPRHAGLRALLAVAAAWTLSVFLASEVYNPAGIDAGHARGEHFPEARYDNNTVVGQMVFGWFGPTVTLLVARIFGLWREAWRTRRARSSAVARHDASRGSR